MMNIKTLKEAPISAGVRVVLRTSLNVPVNALGNPTDVYRLRKALPTIEYLAGKGARVVVIAHLGRDGESLQPTVEALQRLTEKTKIRFFGGTPSQAESQSIENGECLVLENIRREAGEEVNSPALRATLAQLGEIFVNDAFADSHRGHASIVGLAGLLPSFAGLLMEEEIDNLSRALRPPTDSVAIVGGAKFETKEPLIIKLLDLYAHVCVGGALGNDFLKARGVNIAASSVSEALVPANIAHNSRVLLPLDGILQDGAARTAAIEELTSDERILDAGPRTIESWKEVIDAAPLILWNGPLGVYEKGYVEGTNALAKIIADHCEKAGARAVVGGGDTIAALEGIALDEERIFRSTGGGAMLQFLAEGTLPGIEALKK